MKLDDYIAINIIFLKKIGTHLQVAISRIY